MLYESLPVLVRYAVSGRFSMSVSDLSFPRRYIKVSVTLLAVAHMKKKTQNKAHQPGLE